MAHGTSLQPPFSYKPFVKESYVDLWQNLSRELSELLMPANFIDFKTNFVNRNYYKHS